MAGMEQAERIAAARGAARMSQEHLAKAAGVSVRTVIRAEGGHNISPESMRALCAVLDLDAGGIPQPVPEAASPEVVHAALARATDGPVLARDIAMVSRCVAEAVPGLRMAVRPDMVTLNRDYDLRHGIGFDTTRRTYMRNVFYLWMGLYLGGTGLLILGLRAWRRLVGPEDPEIGLYIFCFWMLSTVGVMVAIHLCTNATISMTRTLRTVFAVDATHVHQFRMVRLAHQPREQATTVERLSVPFDEIASVRRIDAHGMTSFVLETASGQVDMRWVVRSEDAPGLERLIGGTWRTPRRCVPSAGPAGDGLGAPAAA